MNTKQKYLLNKLEQSKRLNFQVTHPQPNLSMEFDCELKVSKINDSTLIIEELGDWVNSYGHKVNSKNIYRWSVKNDSLLNLEHLRFGFDKPVFLVNFYNVNNNEWKSIEPHICDKDLYNAELISSQSNIKLKWNILTPQNKYSITSTYYN